MSSTAPRARSLPVGRARRLRPALTALWPLAGVGLAAVALAGAGDRTPAAGSPVPRGVVRAVAAAGQAAVASAPASAPPRWLSETGLYAAGGTSSIAPENLHFVPQYPLWSDGALKRRWLRLPAGTRIDAADPDVWQFPVGTRFWKEFSFGRRTETRYIERVAGGFRYATYVWNAAETDAELAPDRGVRGVAEIARGARHDVPGQSDCRACHEGSRRRILGFGALQLSSDRDPRAAHAEPLPAGAVDLPELERRGLLKDLPPSLLVQPPRISGVGATARAALGYLYANCSSCHNADGPLRQLGLDFEQSVLSRNGAAGWQSGAVGQPSRFRFPDRGPSLRVARGLPERSALLRRLRSREPAAQMPPLGTALVDDAGVRLIAQLISEGPKDPATRKAITP